MTSETATPRLIQLSVLRFRNTGLIECGTYRLRVNFVNDERRKCDAFKLVRSFHDEFPSHFVRRKRLETFVTPGLRGPRVEGEDSGVDHVTTRSFVIKFKEEDVEIRSSFLFSFEASEANDCAGMELNLDLMNEDDSRKTWRTCRTYVGPLNSHTLIHDGLRGELALCNVDSFEMGSGLVEMMLDTAERAVDSEGLPTFLRFGGERRDLDESRRGSDDEDEEERESRNRWKRKARDVLSELVIRVRHDKSELFETRRSVVNENQENAKIANRLRKAPRFTDYDASAHPIAEFASMADRNGRAVVFEHTFTDEGSEKRATEDETEGIRLILFFHGFLGYPHDFRTFESLLIGLNLNLNCETLAFSSNAGENSRSDIRVQAQRALKEFEEFVRGRSVSRLSVVAYSMGVLVARSFLGYLERERSYARTLSSSSSSSSFHTFISINGAHLGSLNGHSALVNMGTLFLTRYHGISSLSQLNLSDEDAYLTELSKNAVVLERFRSMYFVGCSTDSYVPFRSSVLEIFGNGDERVKDMFVCLVASVSQIPKVVKIDLSYDFDTQQRNVRHKFETWLGRSAHVHILDSKSLLLTLLLLYGEEWFE